MTSLKERYDVIVIGAGIGFVPAYTKVKQPCMLTLLPQLGEIILRMPMLENRSIAEMSRKPMVMNSVDRLIFQPRNQTSAAQP